MVCRKAAAFFVALSPPSRSAWTEAPAKRRAARATSTTRRRTRRAGNSGEATSSASPRAGRAGATPRADERRRGPPSGAQRSCLAQDGDPGRKSRGRCPGRPRAPDARHGQSRVRTVPPDRPRGDGLPSGCCLGKGRHTRPAAATTWPPLARSQGAAPGAPAACRRARAALLRRPRGAAPAWSWAQPTFRHRARPRRRGCDAACRATRRYLHGGRARLPVARPGAHDVTPAMCGSAGRPRVKV
eukprot:scaffold149_cov383-Prasinococcus_capsulatus_cf.AAC.16